MTQEKACHSQLHAKSLCVGVFALAMVCSGCSVLSDAQARVPDAVRLWCPSPEGFFPQIVRCTTDWQRQTHEPQPGQARPPLLLIPVPPPPQQASS